jgi:hypothetical protein
LSFIILRKTSFNKRDWLTWSNVVIKIMEISEKNNELLETRWMINPTPFFFANAHFHPFFIQGIDIMSRSPNMSVYCNSWVL